MGASNDTPLQSEPLRSEQMRQRVEHAKLAKQQDLRNRFLEMNSRYIKAEEKAEEKRVINCMKKMQSFNDDFMTATMTTEPMTHNGYMPSKYYECVPEIEALGYNVKILSQRYDWFLWKNNVHVSIRDN